MKKFLGVFSALFLLFTFSKEIFAQVLINEFSSGSTSDWIELYNISTQSADLSSYKLMDSGSNSKNLSGNMAPGGFLSFSFSNWLNNGGDTVRLFNGDVLVDSIGYGGSGQVCVADDGDSIGRYPDGNNTIERFSAPTREASNNGAALDPCPTPTPDPTPSPSPTVTPTSTPTPTPTPTKTPTPVPVKTTGPTPRVLAQATDDNQNSIDKMRQSLATPTPKTLVSAEETTKRKFPLLSLLFISTGLALIGWVGYNYLQNRQSQYNEDDENGLRPL